MSDYPNGNRFYIDRRIPIALILALLAQTMGAAWWASSMNSRVNVIERSIADRSPFISRNSDRLTKVETKLESIEHNTSEIQHDVKRLLRGNQPP